MTPQTVQVREEWDENDCTHTQLRKYLVVCTQASDIEGPTDSLNKYVRYGGEWVEEFRVPLRNIRIARQTSKHRDIVTHHHNNDADPLSSLIFVATHHNDSIKVPGTISIFHSRLLMSSLS